MQLSKASHGEFTTKLLYRARWIILASALIMFMQAGFAMLEAGCCRTGFVSSVLEKNLWEQSACAQRLHRLRVTYSRVDEWNVQEGGYSKSRRAHSMARIGKRLLSGTDPDATLRTAYHFGSADRS